MKSSARKAPPDHIGNIKGRIRTLKERLHQNMSVEDESYPKIKAIIEKKVLSLRKKLAVTKPKKEKPNKDTSLLSVLDNL